MPSEEKTVLVQSLFVQNMMAVRGFVISLMPDFSRVDDVMQETFLTVTAKAETFIEGSNFRSWACSIARFKVLESRRRSGGSELDYETNQDSERSARRHCATFQRLAKITGRIDNINKKWQ